MIYYELISHKNLLTSLVARLLTTAMTGHTPNPLPDLPRPTKAYHKTVYPYLSPRRPELNVSGKTLFITGGGS